MKKLVALLMVIVALLGLTGCDSRNYEKAVGLYEEGQYAEAAEIFEELGDYEDSKERAKKARTQEMYQTYKDVFAALEAGVWFYEAESSNAVNVITFSKESASIHQIYYDGNGPHTTADTLGAYTVDQKNINIVLADENSMTIPYTMDDKGLVLGKGEYFTAEQVEQGLQGYWGLKESDYNPLIGISQSETIYYFNKGKLKYESASKAYGYSDGTYYYYGPYTGTYAVDKTGLKVEIDNAYQFGFVISEGKVVMNSCGDNMEVYSGFKGEDGYSF